MHFIQIKIIHSKYKSLISTSFSCFLTSDVNIAPIYSNEFTLIQIEELFSVAVYSMLSVIKDSQKEIREK